MKSYGTTGGESMKREANWLTALLFAAVAGTVLALCGCGGGVTVGPAARVMVPVRQMPEDGDGGHRRLYIEEPSGACTGW